MTAWPNPLFPGFNPDPSVVLGRRRLLPGDLDVRVPAGHPGLPQHRPGRVDADRPRRDPPGAGRRRGRADRRRRLGADHPAPRRRLLRHRHRSRWARAAARLHRDRPRGPVERRHHDRRASTASTPTSPGTTTAPPTSPTPAWYTFGEDLGKHLGIQQVARRPRRRQGARGAALAVVGHRPEVPGGAAPLPARRPLVPDDRRGRHRARPRRQRRPRAVARGAVRGAPGQPGAQRPQHLRPIQNTGHGDLVETPDGGCGAGACSACGRSGRPRRSRRSAGRRSSPTVAWVDGWPQAEPVELAPARGVEVEDFDFADPAALDDPGWLAVRTLPAEVASLTARPGRLTITGDGATLDDPPPAVRRAAGSGTSPRRSPRRVDASGGRRRTGGAVRRAAPRLARGARQRRDDGRHRAGQRGRARGRPGRSTVPAGEVELRMEMTPAAAGLHARGDGRRPDPAHRGRGRRGRLLTELDGRYWTAETCRLVHRPGRRALRHRGHGHGLVLPHSRHRRCHGPSPSEQFRPGSCRRRSRSSRGDGSRRYDVGDLRRRPGLPVRSSSTCGCPAEPRGPPADRLGPRQYLAPSASRRVLSETLLARPSSVEELRGGTGLADGERGIPGSRWKRRSPPSSTT